MSDKRKKDHIDLAFVSRGVENQLLPGFYYEPLVSAHPEQHKIKSQFLGFDFSFPLWISSMTGGEERAFKINQNLARACGEFSLGMGLGSCRVMLEDKSKIKDFDMKALMPNSPLFSNYGIAQLEQLIHHKQLKKIKELNQTLCVDGMIIHINPLQEWAQMEGDRYKKPAIDTIKTICDALDLPIIVKEVGQGMGPKSLKMLSELPIAAIELAAFSGTNFTLLELARRKGEFSGMNGPRKHLGALGHTCFEMIDWLNDLAPNKMDLIISGGIQSPVIGHQLCQLYQGNSLVGMASEVLKHAMGEYEELQAYLFALQDSFSVAQAFIMRE